jgi:branched-chain amino acid transport system substrate-binding protein
MLKSFPIRLILAVCLAGNFGCIRRKDAKVSGDEYQSSRDEILIGEYASMTGKEATFGISNHKGMQLVFEEKNAAGGIKGKKIRLITYDNQSRNDEAAAVVKRLITQDKVVAVLGEVSSNRTLAAAPIAQEAKVPMVTPSSTNPKITEIGNYIFRVCFTDPIQGTVMARFAAENLKVKRVAILKDISSDYSTSLTDFFVKKFKDLGGIIVSEQTYQNGDKDFKAQLTQIRSAKPEAIFIPGYYVEVPLIARQAKQLGLNATLLGGDGWDSPELYEVGGEAVNGAYFVNHYTSESTEPAVKEFIAKYKARFNEVPDGLSAAGYDAARILLEAIERAPEITPKAVREELTKTKNFTGATGIITFNDQRNAVKSAVIVKVDGANMRYVTTIHPQ